MDNPDNMESHKAHLNSICHSIAILESEIVNAKMNEFTDGFAANTELSSALTIGCWALRKERDKVTRAIMKLQKEVRNVT